MRTTPPRASSRRRPPVYGARRTPARHRSSRAGWTATNEADPPTGRPDAAVAKWLGAPVQTRYLEAEPSAAILYRRSPAGAPGHRRPRPARAAYTARQVWPPDNGGGSKRLRPSPGIQSELVNGLKRHPPQRENGQKLLGKTPVDAQVPDGCPPVLRGRWGHPLGGHEVYASRGAPPAQARG